MKTLYCLSLTALAIAWAYLTAPLKKAGDFYRMKEPMAGGDQVPNHFARKFDDDVKLVSQQKQSRLEGTVIADYEVVGMSKSFDTIGASEAQVVTGRNQDVQYNNSAHGRRWIDLSDYDWADYVDSFDKLKVLEDPTNKYLAAGIGAMNRAKDRVIITAIFGSARETTVSGATETSSLSALGSGQKIVNGGTNITMAKLRSGIELLNAAESGSPEEGGERTFLYTANQLTKLMADSTLTSSDYNTLKALQDYKVDFFMGLRWIRTELLPKSGNIRSCAIYAREGVGLGVGSTTKTDVSQRKDKRGQPWQVYLLQSIGAVRGKDNCVVQIDCDETA